MWPGFVWASVNEVKVRSRGKAPIAAAMLLWFTGAADPFQEVRPGVWADRDVGTLPLPDSGYQVSLDSFRASDVTGWRRVALRSGARERKQPQASQVQQVFSFVAYPAGEGKTS
jgi:hypothetical protein